MSADSPRSGNLFANVPALLDIEETAVLAELPGARVERIVSTGQASAPGFWYDQDQKEWVVVLAGSAGLTIEGDTTLLRTMLTNLLGNAWKFTRGREPAVIRFESQVREGKTVYSVRDNGIGFSTGHAEELFAPFKRLHGKMFEGTGIGLATVARIVQRHGGSIWAESEPDAGATFFFTLGDAGAA